MDFSHRKSSRELMSFADEAAVDPESENSEQDIIIIRSDTRASRSSPVWRHVALAGTALALAACAALAARTVLVHSQGPQPAGSAELVELDAEEYEEEPAEEDGPTTTIWTTTTSVAWRSSSHDDPSLFCWLVSQTVGGEKVNRVQGWWEEKLVWEMFMNKVGIFACNEFAVFTDKRAIISKMGPWGWPYVDEDYNATEGEILSWELGNTQTRRNGDSSPANTLVFNIAWKVLLKSGVMDKHNWVVKQDPDAVFFPWRLRWHAGTWPDESNKDGQTPLFIKNCEGFNSMQGPLEIFSISLVKLMVPHLDECGLDAVGEDSKMEKCAKQFGSPYMDSSVLLDKYCQHAPPDCNSGDIVAYHPFKEIPNFRKCVKESMAAEAAYKKANPS